MMNKIKFTGITAITVIMFLTAGCDPLDNAEWKLSRDHTPLAENVWTNGTISSGSEVWYSVTDRDPNIWWNDRKAGDGTKTADIQVNVYYSDKHSDGDRDSGWVSPAQGSSSRGGTIYLRVTASNSGTFAIAYNISGIFRPGFTLSYTLVQIPAGTFQTGSPETEPDRESDETRHQVTLTKGFYMGKYQVTQDQYQAVMWTNPSYFTTSVFVSGQTANRPVEGVSWYDAIVFCNRLSMAEGFSPAYRIKGSTDPSVWGTVPTSSNSTWNAVQIVEGSTGYRLPTEAQWEYACRAGTTTAYNTGATISDNTGWYVSNSGSRTHEVGLKPANAWGLYDMHGNVWEWCWDRYGTYESGAQTDPAGAFSGSYRVLRGGSWNSYGQYLRSAYRDINYPDRRYRVIGFRLSRPAQ
jgi:formylglycine-generating enzyme required for sulfatase activity